MICERGTVENTYSFVSVCPESGLSVRMSRDTRRQEGSDSQIKTHVWQALRADFGRYANNRVQAHAGVSA